MTCLNDNKILYPNLKIVPRIISNPIKYKQLKIFDNKKYIQNKPSNQFKYSKELLYKKDTNNNSNINTNNNYKENSTNIEDNNKLTPYERFKKNEQPELSYNYKNYGTADLICKKYENKLQDSQKDNNSSFSNQAYTPYRSNNYPNPKGISLKKEYDPQNDQEDAKIEEIIWMIDNDML